jgi:SNF2 family DNA or RNA helicase
MIAVDEIHKIATKTSQQGNNLLKLKSDYQIAATGSPITNSPLSIYIPLSWTDIDKSNLTNYKNLYCEMEQGPFHNQQIIGYKNLLFLQDEIHKHSIRRTFNQIRDNMPKKTIEYELVEMSNEHRKFYEDIKNGVKEEADKIELNINNLLALTTRLRQATSIPSLLTSQNISSSKIERCVDIAESVLNNKEKLVIFCNFIESANELYKLLSKYNPILGTGQQEDNYILEGIEKFRNSNNYNLLICTHSKMGTGFSFPECHYALMLDTPFTYSQFSQSCDRIYRITSEQPVYIKVLACKDTYDERVRNIIENKKDLGDFLIDKKDINIINELKNSIINL